jgi:hypothetical protein
VDRLAACALLRGVWANLTGDMQSIVSYMESLGTGHFTNDDAKLLAVLERAHAALRTSTAMKRLDVFTGRDWARCSWACVAPAPGRGDAVPLATVFGCVRPYRAIPRLYESEGGNRLAGDDPVLHQLALDMMRNRGDEASRLAAADRLEESGLFGVVGAELVNHLRTEVHFRGCWVVDALLNLRRHSVP